ncbi:type IV toxin-antitoxin system AbiEi family antitoxin domain-containing protein [Microbacterium sp. EYE_5]|nr:type IV toxin-antitoxin system AbiEi family antitoxin domain-containing protein [Microbacterium sp. EYE_382]MCK6087051.1 type IV toxin-antitoxin system AbiEi family antitoxin domain-containing protein [Microbacterium sp. EYE_384]MCK6124971.1 type IV toxin-antitoxin system AbiEi family antitoxin domain-containing protein [Microbacterium sp. EYE_80]MCK6127814.1 type IV toxin-antitoxin system AbiEi family antitoxin domain-containing protein [Microbacterium sp. EYE_79]MCK6142735.1 type IV toxin-
MCGDTSISTFAALRAAGMPRSAIDRAVQRGTLHRVRNGVYATRDACVDVVGAAAHGGSTACITAARHLGLWVLDDDPATHVWMGHDGRAHHAAGCGCVVHWDGGARRGFGIPSLAIILWQIRRCRGLESFFVALESALRQGMLRSDDRSELVGLLDHEAQSVLALARTDADSGLESLVRFRLRGHGLRIRTQVSVVAVGRVDLMIGGNLIVEVDGRENHEGPSHRHRDLVRDANAAVWGHRTLRFDYAMIIHDWDLVERAILAAVAESS